MGGSTTDQVYIDIYIYTYLKSIKICRKWHGNSYDKIKLTYQAQMIQDLWNRSRTVDVFGDEMAMMSQVFFSLWLGTLEVQPHFFIGWFPKHHVVCMGLSCTKRNHLFLKWWQRLPGVDMVLIKFPELSNSRSWKKRVSWECSTGDENRRKMVGWLVYKRRISGQLGNLLTC